MVLLQSFQLLQLSSDFVFDVNRQTFDGLTNDCSLWQDTARYIGLQPQRLMKDHQRRLFIGYSLAGGSVNLIVGVSLVAGAHARRTSIFTGALRDHISGGVEDGVQQ